MPHARARHQPTVIDTDASSSFACDYVAGINRVLSMPPYLLVDNIGRNIEVWRFQSGGLDPVARARYDLTSYPGDPIASLLDVDLHGAFLRGDGRELLTVNHYGRVRRFDLLSGPEMRPTREWQLLGDTERVAIAGHAFITSSPRGEFTADPAQPGICLFEPIAADAKPESGPPARLDFEPALADWGVITALAASAGHDRLAVAAGQRLGVFRLACDSAGVRLGGCIWESALACHCQWLQFEESGYLWAGGHRPVAVNPPDGNWDACCGGSIDAFESDGRRHHVATALPEATAWGYGADPIVVSADGGELYVLGRDASLHVVTVRTGAQHRRYAAVESQDGVASPSLGIGHATRREGWVYAGFSRGGFRLIRYDVRPA